MGDFRFLPQRRWAAEKELIYKVPNSLRPSVSAVKKFKTLINGMCHVYLHDLGICKSNSVTDEFFKRHSHRC